MPKKTQLPLSQWPRAILAAHAAQPNSPTAQQPNSPTAHYYSAVTAAKSAFNVELASLPAAPRRPSAACCLSACFRVAAAFRLTAIGVAALAAFAAFAVCLCRTALVFIAAAAAVVSLVPAFASARSRPIPPLPAKFVTSACPGPNGGIWLASEGDGVFHYNPKASSAWQNFSIGTPVNHNASYAITCDTRGRIWVGSLNEGVFVLLPSRDQGQPARWRRYGLLADPSQDELAGPIGEHVYSIRVDPVDGSVWICTNSGISRYEPGRGKARGRWVYYDVANGLPSDDVQCVAFGPHGRACIATTCCGIAISRPTRTSLRASRKNDGHGPLHYGRWRAVKSRFTQGPPLTPTGRGLPSNLINAIITTRTGVIWVATDEGIAWSTDHGRRWSFLRGANWAAKDAGLVHPASAAFILNAGRLVPKTGTLSSDYCTCLAAAPGGDIYIGHRKTGVDILNPVTGAIWRSDQAGTTTERGHLLHQFIDAILMLRSGGALLGCYGGGVEEMPLVAGGARQNRPKKNGHKAGQRKLRFPAEATAPTKRQLAADRRRLGALVQKFRSDKRLAAVALGSDWRTEGNWLGRYGNYAMELAAALHEGDIRWGQGWDDPQWGAWMGPHPGRSDGIRSWIQWPYASDRRVLELPKPDFLARWYRARVPGNNKSLCRRQSEWDDHGEAYSSTTQGPGLYVSFGVPPGVYLLALYGVNYNGHSGPMRYRDFPVTLGVYPSTAGQFTKKQCVERSAQFDMRLEPGPPRVIAWARFSQFRNGEWIRFLVRGPNLFVVHLGRNYSLNTMLPCASLSLAESRPPPYFFPFPTHNQCRYGKFVDHHWVPQVPPKPKITSGHLVPIARYLYEHYRYPAYLEMPAWRASADLYAGELRSLAGTPGGLATPAHAALAMHLLYRLGRFRRMERVQSGVGFLTARRIELNLPWLPELRQGTNPLGPPLFQPYMVGHGYYRRQRRAARALERASRHRN